MRQELTLPRGLGLSPRIFLASNDADGEFLTVYVHIHASPCCAGGLGVNRPYSTAYMNIFLCDMHGQASPLMRYMSMAELSDTF